MKNLKSLIIKNNRNLEKISGLEKQKSLVEFSCYGNDSLNSIENLDKIILANAELNTIKLDMLLYPDSVKYNAMDNSYNDNAIANLNRINNTSKIVFIETMLKKEVNISYSKMFQMNQKAHDIIKGMSGDDVSITKSISEYIAKNISCSKDDEKTFSENKEIVGARSNSNGAFSAIMNNVCNNEGYARAMQYLLKLKGIGATKIYCVEKDNQDENQYNSVISLGEDRYTDPALNAELYNKGNESETFKIKNIEEMKQIYKFDGIHLQNEVTKEFIKERGARISEVNRMKKSLEIDKNKAKEETLRREGGYDRGERGVKQGLY